MTESIDPLSVDAGGDSPRYRVEVGPDPTPMMLWLSGTLRRTAREDTGPEDLGALAGTAVGLTEIDGRQTASVAFGDGVARVTRKVPGGLPAVVDIAADGELSAVGEVLPVGLQRVLRPTLPSWRVAAQRFWQLTGADPGMPARLTVEADDGDRAVFGGGAPDYTFVGPGPELARVLTGRTLLLDALKDGAVAVRGTFPQLSVMVGASWKARWYA